MSQQLLQRWWRGTVGVPGGGYCWGGAVSRVWPWGWRTELGGHRDGVGVHRVLAGGGEQSRSPGTY